MKLTGNGGGVLKNKLCSIAAMKASFNDFLRTYFLELILDF